ncbi:ester cyclase [Streptomyces sp. SID14478]|uniref:ester cyclase n=1 Tax=Streptomyces sp. SID14478 TaxID=2706073 RepID=UPI0013DF7F59|nr:ester cyclase [Streptomyces sp. SID14478]NEB80957.1 ester cyclase [Streptomyces sp. SID14478]
MYTAEEARNVAAFEHYHSAGNAGDLEVFGKAVDEAFAPDFLFHTPLPMGTTGHQALKQVWETLLRAYPDLHVEVQDVLADGDKIVARNTVTGTHRGEIHGIAPTGRKVSYDEIFILRFADGLITEIWGVVDVLAQLRQLG